MDKTRSIRADLERTLLRRVGLAELAGTALVVAALLDQLGLSEQVANRTVPAPPEE